MNQATIKLKTRNDYPNMVWGYQTPSGHYTGNGGIDLDQATWEALQKLNAISEGRVMKTLQQIVEASFNAGIETGISMQKKE